MPRVVYGQDELVAKWTAERIETVDDFGDCAGLAVVTGDRVMAGIVFNGYRPNFSTIEVSVAADSVMWARPRIIAEILAYPFRQLGVHTVFSTMAAGNDRAIKFNKHLGFRRPTTVGHFFGPGRHAVVTRMLQPDYERVYGGKYGQEFTQRSDSA